MQPAHGTGTGRKSSKPHERKINNKNDIIMFDYGTISSASVSVKSFINGDRVEEECCLFAHRGSGGYIKTKFKSQVGLLQTAHSWANAGVVLDAHVRRRVAFETIKLSG